MPEYSVPGKRFKTSEVAAIIGIHPNTVRMYEDLGFISKPLRENNGYRVFTDLHIAQFKLARIAFQIEVLQNGLRKKAVDIVKLSGACEFDQAIRMTDDYIAAIDLEMEQADAAGAIARELLSGRSDRQTQNLKRKEVSELLGISMDTLRNWEMNGLIKVKRKENGYRVYTDDEIKQLKMIRSLKCANYSLSAILRMMNELDRNSGADIEAVLNTPREDEDVISVCDRLILSLSRAGGNALIMKSMLLDMKRNHSNPPL